MKITRLAAAAPAGPGGAPRILCEAAIDEAGRPTPAPPAGARGAATGYDRRYAVRYVLERAPDGAWRIAEAQLLGGAGAGVQP